MKAAKKLVSLLLTLIMVLSMSVTVWAAESKLTINTAAGHTYEVYQMLTGDVSGLTNGSGTLANVVKGTNLSGTVEAFDLAISEKNEDGTAKKDENGNTVYLKDTDLSAAARALITGDPVKTITGNGEAQSVTLTDGYYVVVDKYSWEEDENGDGEADVTKNGTAYMVAVVGDTTMSPKTSTPPFDKNIVDTDANKALETGDSKKTDTAAIGDVINFRLDSAVPVTSGYKYYFYEVTDKMSKGLTFNDDVVVKIGDNILTKGTDYTLTSAVDADTKITTIVLTIADLKAYVDANRVAVDTPIVITYSATVNDEADIEKIPNTNEARLKYSNDPSSTFNNDVEDDVHGITPWKTTKTYVTELDIQKTNGTAFIPELAGATFKLTGTGLNDVLLVTETYFEEAADGEYYKLKDGTYTKTAPTDQTTDKYASTTQKYAYKTKVSLTDGESGAELNITAVVNSLGQITFKGLNAGTYKIEEIVVPEGYNKCDDITFTITAGVEGATDAAGGNIVWGLTGVDPENSVALNETTGVYKATIVNKKGNLLPSTGGIGTTIFYIAGAVLVLAAGVVLIARKRVNK